MEWITQLQGRLVGLDTAPLIYFIEENPTYINMMDAFFEAMDRGEFRVVTSVITLLEVLVYPLRQLDNTLADQYRNILSFSPSLRTVEVSREIAEKAAELRAIYNLQTPDSIQMATAIVNGASFFLTNDVRLPSISGLQLLVLEDLRQ
ncbi:PIN domain-containing protein [Laspinema sp. D1]|uniref:type II toxin-antitoxin system VapC family toxin n=1 Tax=Laspinema palackyanum TaxID=3231601 RepID=UPI003475A4A1|nr:PIN domain-containing protein [Laspinema sp. D2b]